MEEFFDKEPESEFIEEPEFMQDEPEPYLELIENQTVEKKSFKKITSILAVAIVVIIAMASGFPYSGVLVIAVCLIRYRIKNKKPKYNVNAVFKDNEVYLKAVEINEAIQKSKNREVENAIRNVMEHLRNESSFGMGSDLVISCETDIGKCLEQIENDMQGLLDERTSTQAEEIILTNCKTIQAKLKIRMELKKR